jgi:hypothetical protein
LATARASARPLKDQNQLALLSVLAVNLVVLVMAIRTDSLLSSGIDSLLRQWREVAPAGIGVVLIGVVNGLLSPLTKARLVYWRWSNPLPASFAFSRYAEADARINLAVLKKKVGPFPRAPRDQNSLWYKLYRSVADESAVANAHRASLFTRDYAGIAFLMLLVGGAIGWWCIPSTATAEIYTVLLLVQYLLVRHAAQNYGVRFVTTVLAFKAVSS